MDAMQPVKKPKGKVAYLMAAVVLKRGKKVMMAKTKGWDGGTWWFLPVDTIRFGEDPAKAASRIGKEWFGTPRLKVRVSQVQHHDERGKYWLPTIVYEGQAPARYRKARDVLEVGFFDPAKPPKPSGFDARRILKEWRRGR
jgi:ADP-ribose pyrophosphatase YjhB (NUDIX family)